MRTNSNVEMLDSEIVEHAVFEFRVRDFRALIWAKIASVYHRIQELLLSGSKRGRD